MRISRLPLTVVVMLMGLVWAVSQVQGQAPMPFGTPAEQAEVHSPTGDAPEAFALWLKGGGALPNSGGKNKGGVKLGHGSKGKLAGACYDVICYTSQPSTVFCGTLDDALGFCGWWCSGGTGGSCDYIP